MSLEEHRQRVLKDWAEAERLGLVDTMGYQADAIDRAAELAGLDEPKVVAYGWPQSPLAFLQAGPGQTTGQAVVRELIDEAQTPRIMLIWKVR